MKSGDRIFLNADIETNFGRQYKRGQTGTICYLSEHFGDAVVDLDGYDEEREAQRKQREKDGEGFNIVSYYARFPLDVLELASECRFDAFSLMDAMESAEGSVFVWHERIDGQWRQRTEHGPRRRLIEWQHKFLPWSPDAKVANITLFDSPWWARGPLAKLWRKRILWRLQASSGYAEKLLDIAPESLIFYQSLDQPG